MMYKGVIFDLDNTLCWHLDEPHSRMKEQIDQRLIDLGIEPNTFWRAYTTNEADVYQKFQKQQLSKEEYRLQRFLLPLQEVNEDACLEEAALFNQVYTSTMNRYLHYYNDAVLALLDLQKKHIPIYLLTNGTVEAQRQKIEALDLDLICKQIFISEEIGYRKPDIRAFSYVHGEIGLEKQEILMVGDSVLDDCYGAEDYGLKAVWINRGQKSMRGVSEIKSLTSLRDFFE